MFLSLMFTKAPVETVIFWNIIAILNNHFLFLYILTLLQFSVSHDLSEIILICWFAAQDTFLNINNVENNYKTNIMKSFLLLIIFVLILFFVA